jgi:hypothetical protein
VCPDTAFNTSVVGDQFSFEMIVEQLLQSCGLFIGWYCERETVFKLVRVFLLFKATFFAVDG